MKQQRALRRVDALVGLCLLLALLSPNLFLFEDVGLPGVHRAFAVDPTAALPVLLINLLLVVGVLAVAGRAWIAALVLLPFLLWIPAEWFYLLHFGTPTNAQSLGVISETDPAEAAAWLGRSGMAILLVIGGLGLSLGPWILRLARAGVQWQHRSRWLVAGVLLPAALAVAILMGRDEVADSATPGESAEAPEWQGVLTRNDAGWPETFVASYPIGTVIRALDFYRQRQMLAGVAARPVPAFVASQVPRAQRQIYVMVIGESTRADHLGLNGYPRDTTPLLRRRDVVSFSDFVSATSATRSSVPTFLLPDTEGTMVQRYAQPSLLDAMREAGFSTYWISTQAPFGKFDTPISAIARRAGTVRFINPGDYRQRGLYDGQLLPVLEEVLARNEDKVFIVLHTLGSHADYRYRYPADFQQFAPVLPPDRLADPWNRGQRTELVNAYDNAVRYTDHVLDGIIDALDRRQAESWMLYVSDHGETLFDGSCEKSGHGFPSEANHRPAMLFWPSPSFAAGHGAAIDQLRRNAGRPADYRAVLHTTLDLANIQSPRRRPELSLVAADYIAGPRRVDIGARTIDFDREMKAVDCANGK